MTNVIIHCTLSARGSLPNNARPLHARVAYHRVVTPSTLLQMLDAISPLVAFVLLEHRYEADSQSNALNGLVAHHVSLNTKSTAYKEALGQQNCLLNTLQEFNKALCDQLAQTRVRISELELSISILTRSIVVEGQKLCSAQKSRFTNVPENQSE